MKGDLATRAPAELRPLTSPHTTTTPRRLLTALMSANDTEAGSFIHLMTPKITASSWRWSSLTGMPGPISAPGGGSGSSLYGGTRLMGMLGGSGDAAQAATVTQQIA